MKDCGHDYIVLQVRLGSTRLPKKALLPLEGTTIFEHILKRLSMANLTEGIIVATTEDTAPQIENIAKRYSASIFIGSEEDVLSRYVSCVSKYRIRNVVRATGDNPLVSIEYLDRAVSLHREEMADLTIYPLLPYGTGVEVISGKTLEETASDACDPFEREHPTQYIYRNESRYKIVRGVPDPVFQRRELRLTVDTEEDYRRMVEIYRNLYRGMPINLIDVIHYLDGKAR